MGKGDLGLGRPEFSAFSAPGVAPASVAYDLMPSPPNLNRQDSHSCLTPMELL